MTPKDKAEELVGQFWESAVSDCDHRWGRAKLCALIAVDEILKAPFENTYIDIIPEDQENTDWFWDHFRKYWNDVKNEIELL